MAATTAVVERYKRQINEQESTEVEAAWGAAVRSDGQKSNYGSGSRRGSGGGGRGETAVTATGTAKTGLVDGGGGEKEATAWCGRGRCSSRCSRCTL